MDESVIIIAGIAAAVIWAVLGNVRPRLAMLTFIWPAVGLLLTRTVEGTVSAFVVFVGTVLSAALAKSAPKRSSWLDDLAKAFLYILIALALLIFLIFCFLTSGPGIIILMLAAGATIRFSLVSRDATVTHVFSTIGACMRQNLPLGTSLKAEAQSLKGTRRRIMEQIADWLTRGYPLSEALKLGYRKCPGYALAMITAAERVQQVPQAVASIEAQLAQRSIEDRKVRAISPAYPIVVILVMLVVLSGIMIVVMPKFKVLFKDVGAQLPLATRIVLSVSRGYAGWFTLLIALVILVIVPLAIYMKFRPRRPGKPYLTSRIGDWVKWYFPVLGWFERNYSLMQTVSFLRFSIDSGSTVDKAIAGATELDTNNRYRQRLVGWLEQVQRGQNVSESARRCGVGRAVAWAFDEKINQGNTPGILESLESFYRSHYGYIVNLARMVFWPCVVILMGITVGFVVYAVFSPYVALIYAAVDATMP